VHYLARRPAEKEALQRAADLIKKAKRPMLICGGGVRYSEAHAEFASFAKTFGIPFGETQAGKSAVLGVNHVHGKGRKGRLFGQAGIHHGSNLVGQLGLVGCLVEFHRVVAPVGGCVHTAFAAPAQPFTQLQSTPTAQTQFQAVGRVFLMVGTRGHGRWSVSGMGVFCAGKEPLAMSMGPDAVSDMVS